VIIIRFFPFVQQSTGATIAPHNDIENIVDEPQKSTGGAIAARHDVGNIVDEPQ